MERARVAAGLTQQQLADRSDLTVTTICGTETGRSRPRYSTADKIATALGRTVRDFWPLLADAVEQGRLLGTVIPVEQAVRSTRGYHHGMRLVYSDPQGGQLVRHFHRPPLCCGDAWCRCVDLSDPETYRVIAEPVLIAASGGA